MGTFTTGQIEARACEAVVGFQRGLLGRGPRTISATLRADTLYVHLETVLTTAERSLLSAGGESHERGTSLVREMRNLLVRQARGDLLAALSGAIGRPAEGLFHDVDPATGTEVMVFQLSPHRQPSTRLA